MKRFFIIFLLFTLTLRLHVQEWTEPVNVSNWNDFILYSDMTIDSNGHFHCIWTIKYEATRGEVFYSFSEDNGETWSEPVSVSNDSSYYYSHPRIAHDSENNIYAVYDLNDYDPQNWGSYSVIVKKGSSGWEEPLVISEGIATTVAVDNNDRVYVFWFMGAPHSGESYYQYMEDGEWSEIICPFNKEELCGITEVVVDSENNLHCAGFHDSTASLDARTCYIYFDYENETWDYPVDLSTGLSEEVNVIALDTNQNPHLAWDEGPVVYSWFNGQQWSINDTVVNKNPKYMSMAIDSYNGVHIATTESSQPGVDLVHYEKNETNGWDYKLIDHGDNVIFTPILRVYENSLYTTYNKSDSVPYGDIFFSSFDIITSSDSPINFIRTSSDSLIIFPNPFRDQLNLVSLNEIALIDQIIVSNSAGQVVKFIQPYFAGTTTSVIRWDATDHYGNKLPGGVYFFTIVYESKFQTLKIIKY